MNSTTQQTDIFNLDDEIKDFIKSKCPGRTYHGEITSYKFIQKPFSSVVTMIKDSGEYLNHKIIEDEGVFHAKHRAFDESIIVIDLSQINIIAFIYEAEIVDFKKDRYGLYRCWPEG